MAKIKDYGQLFNWIRLAWIGLISKIKNFFSSNMRTSSSTSSNEQSASNKNGYDGDIKEANIGNEIEIKNDEINSEDEQEVWYDALTEQELDEDEYFDAVEDLNEQEINVDNGRKECEKDKYYSLQGGLQEKTELNRSTQTLALAFKIDKLQLGNCNPNLSEFKLCELKQNGDKYTFVLENDQKNRIKLHSEYLNIYFPQYFNKCSEKRAYTKLFSPKENRISNDIIIPLQVPKEVSILTEEFGWMNPIKAKIQSQIPDFPEDIYLKDCKDHVNFHLNLNNTVSLSITSMKAKLAATLSGTPTETNWPIKDVLVRGEFANTVNKHIYKQPEVEEVSSDEEVGYDFEHVEITTGKKMSSGI